MNPGLFDDLLPDPPAPPAPDEGLFDDLLPDHEDPAPAYGTNAGLTDPGGAPTAPAPAGFGSMRGILDPNGQAPVAPRRSIADQLGPQAANPGEISSILAQHGIDPAQAPALLQGLTSSDPAAVDEALAKLPPIERATAAKVLRDTKKPGAGDPLAGVLDFHQRQAEGHVGRLQRDGGDLEPQPAPPATGETSKPFFPDASSRVASALAGVLQSQGEPAQPITGSDQDSVQSRLGDTLAGVAKTPAAVMNEAKLSMTGGLAGVLRVAGAPGAEQVAAQEKGAREQQAVQTEQTASPELTRLAGSSIPWLAGPAGPLLGATTAGGERANEVMDEGGSRGKAAAMGLGEAALSILAPAAVHGVAGGAAARVGKAVGGEFGGTAGAAAEHAVLGAPTGAALAASSAGVTLAGGDADRAAEQLKDIPSQALVMLVLGAGTGAAGHALSDADHRMIFQELQDRVASETDATARAKEQAKLDLLWSHISDSHPPDQSLERPAPPATAQDAETLATTSKDTFTPMAQEAGLPPDHRGLPRDADRATAMEAQREQDLADAAHDKLIRERRNDVAAGETQDLAEVKTGAFRPVAGEGDAANAAELRNQGEHPGEPGRPAPAAGGGVDDRVGSDVERRPDPRRERTRISAPEAQRGGGDEGVPGAAGAAPEAASAPVAHPLPLKVKAGEGDAGWKRLLAGMTPAELADPRNRSVIDQVGKIPGDEPGNPVSSLGALSMMVDGRRERAIREARKASTKPTQPTKGATHGQHSDQLPRENRAEQGQGQSEGQGQAQEARPAAERQQEGRPGVPGRGAGGAEAEHPAGGQRAGSAGSDGGAGERGGRALGAPRTEGDFAEAGFRSKGDVVKPSNPADKTGPQRPPAEPIEAPRAPARRRGPRIPELESGPDILNHIADAGGIRSKSSSEGAAARYGDYDGLPPLPGVYNRIMRGRGLGGSAPDEMASQLHREHGIGDGTSDTLWKLIDDAVQSRRYSKARLKSGIDDERHREVPREDVSGDWKPRESGSQGPETGSEGRDTRDDPDYPSPFRLGAEPNVPHGTVDRSKIEQIVGRYGTVVEHPDGTLEIQGRGGATIRVKRVGEIGQGGAVGQFQLLDRQGHPIGEIRLLDGKAQAKTLSHELVHAFRAMGLISGPEWRALADHLATPERMDEINRRYREHGIELTHDQLREEAVAEAIEECSEAGPLPPVGIWRKITEFFHRIGRALGLVKPRGEQVARDVQEGRPLEREPTAAGDGEPRNALLPEDQDPAVKNQQKLFDETNLAGHRHIGSGFPPIRSPRAEAEGLREAAKKAIYDAADAGTLTEQQASSEWKFLRDLTAPEEVQAYIEGLKQRHGIEVDTSRSPQVLAERQEAARQGPVAEPDATTTSTPPADYREDINRGKAKREMGQQGLFDEDSEGTAGQQRLFSVPRATANSEGRPIARDKEALKKFRTWFKDSKAVDEQGRPVVVYHGTNQPVESFDHERRGQNTGSVSSKVAFFFTEHPAEADEYAAMSARHQLPNTVAREKTSERLLAAMERARARRDFDLEEQLNRELEHNELHDRYGDPSGQAVVPVYLRVRNPLVVDFKDSVDLHSMAEKIAEAKAGGHDGLKMLNVYDVVGDRPTKFSTTQWAVFHPEQIKSAIGNRGTFDPKNPDIRYSIPQDDKKGPIWRYKSADIVANDPKFPNKAQGDQVLAYLKNKGVNDREIYWSGLDSLKGQKGITKEMVAGILAKPRIKLDETVRGERLPPFKDAEEAKQFLAKTSNMTVPEVEEAFGYTDPRDYITNANAHQAAHTDNTKFGQYALPGGKNYREMLLRLPFERKPGETPLPSKDEWLKRQSWYIHGQRPGAHNEQVLYDQWVSRESNTHPTIYKSSHWQEPNVLLHTRFNERADATGKKVLHIEEIQSDWHQAGREKGYAIAEDLTKAPPGTTIESADVAGRFRFVTNDVHSRTYLSEPEAIAAAWREHGVMGHGRVPQAPFAKTWEEIGLKRMIRQAAEQGIDKITWTTGEQQAERYNLAKRVKHIEWMPKTPMGNAADSGGETYSVANDKDGWLAVHGINGDPLIDKPMSHQEVVDAIGKDAAHRLMNAPLEARGNTRIPAQSLSGEGLKVGGEGMKAAYDQRLVSIAKKIGEKYGVEPGMSSVEAMAPKRKEPGSGWTHVDNSMEPEPLERQSYQVHSLDIPPAMRDDVLKGQHLAFSIPRDKTKGQQKLGLEGEAKDEEPAKPIESRQERIALPAEKAKPVGEATKLVVDAKNDLQRIFAPQTRGEDAASVAGLVRESAATLAQRTDRATEALKQASSLVMRLPEKQRWAFVDRMEHGEPQPNASAQKVANTIRQILDSRREEIRALGTGKLEKFIENYFPHIWEDPKKAEIALREAASKKPLQGSKAFLKQRTIDSIQHGIDLGLKPVSKNPIEMVLLKAREMDKYLMAQRLMAELKARGITKFVKATEKAPDDLAPINDSVAKVFAPPGASEIGGITKMGEYMAPPPVANVMNNYLSPGLREKSGLFRGFLAAGNFMNQFQLGFSAFHLGFTSLDAATSRFANGIMHLADGGLKGLGHFAKSLATAPLAPFTNFLEGSKVLREWYRPGSQGEHMAAIVDALRKAGGRARQDAFYQSNMTKKMVEAFQNGNIGGAVMRLPFSIMEQLGRPIMEWIVPRQKLGIFADMARRELANLPRDASEDQVRASMGKAWDSVDNRMGQLVYDNLFWNKTAKDLAMASVRSFGWNIGTIRELGGGGLDIARATKALLTGGKVTMTHRMAYVAALPVITGILGATLQYMMTGKGPTELRDYFFPKTGAKDANGNDSRLSLPSYMKDVYQYGHDPVQTLTNKLHPLIGTISDMLRNKDYYGQPIRNSDDSLVKQATDLAKYVGTQAEPFGLRNYLQGRESNLTAAQRAAAFVGVTPAPKWISQSSAEQLASEINAKGHGGPPPAVPLANLKTKVGPELRSDDPDARAAAMRELSQAIKDGTITKAAATHMAKAARRVHLVNQVEYMAPPDAVRVYAASDPDERAELYEAVGRKLTQAHIAPAQKKELFDRFMELAKDRAGK